MLRLPLRNIDVNQPFWVNYLDYYKKLWLKGHNWIDFRSMNGFSCYATHSGVVLFAWTYPDGWIGVEIWDKVQWIKTIYYHFKDTTVITWEEVIAWQKIWHCDNTWLMTTWNHLHFGLKRVDKDGNTLDYNNGFKGAIDPTPFFNQAYDGSSIGNKDCYKPNAYHRYYRGRPDGWWQNEIRIVWELIPYLRRLPRNEEINACVYWGWNREVLKNPALYQLWAYIKKDEYEKGLYPFRD